MNSNSYPMNNIVAPCEHDVLCGRGGHTIHWSGNIKFRALVEAHRDRYHSASRVEKGKVVAEVVQLWRTLTPPGRFLTLTDPKLGDASPWHDIGDKSSQKKTAKRLREVHTTTMSSSSVTPTVVSHDDFSSDSSISSHSVSVRRVSNTSMERAAKRSRREMNESFEQVPAMDLLMEIVDDDDFELPSAWAPVKKFGNMEEDLLVEDLNLDSLFEESIEENNSKFNFPTDSLHESLLSLTFPAHAPMQSSWNASSFGSPLLEKIAGSIPSAAALTAFSLFD